MKIVIIGLLVTLPIIGFAQGRDSVAVACGAGPGTKITIVKCRNSSQEHRGPFYIIGVPLSQMQWDSLGNPLNRIDPNEIESIDVLNVNDAIEIYGSRASEGAILIKTKRGKCRNVSGTSL
jgi:TonB-dependent starch-binding outer membrane protein SusC